MKNEKANSKKNQDKDPAKLIAKQYSTNPDNIVKINNSENLKR